MKKMFALLLALAMSLGLLAGCGDSNNASSAASGSAEGAKKIETLKVAFVPSREPQEIITATEPLKQLLKDELAKEGYDAKLGARPLQRLLREALEDPLAGEVLFGRLVKGGTVIVDEPEDGGDKLVLRFEEK